MDVTIIEELYAQHEALCNVVICALVFGGMARIAFWRDLDGLRVGGPLAVGIAMLLTVALLRWTREEHRTISELGPYAAFVLVQAIITMAWAAFRKSARN